MKRTPLRRKTRLRSRGRSRYPKARRMDYRAWIREQPCILSHLGHTCEGVGDRQRIEACHVKTWGSSGTDEGNLFPACPTVHDMQEGRTKEFEKRFKLNLSVAAQQYWTAYEQEQGRSL